MSESSSPSGLAPERRGYRRQVSACHPRPATAGGARPARTAPLEKQVDVLGTGPRRYPR
ncbi:hypothetical protein ACFV3R_06340 [Streptomyces sp. NPDC059740]|uniref:hypothetical protein n=1 Tax=Streptomyces sp. NPDC059740 TaxID=3346926 RepID=UPI003647B15A